MKDDLATKPQIHVAALEHLTGPSRGSIAWFNEAPVDVLLTSDRHIAISPSLPGESREGLIARIQQTEKGFEIETVGGRHLWINGKPVKHAKIDHLDIIEFGENGPLSRLFVHGEGEQARVSVGEAVSDAIAYFKVSRRPLLSRISNTLGLIMRQLTRETTLLFRISVVVAIGILAALAYQQYRMNVLLQQQIKISASQLEDFARTLVRTREEALTPGDLEALRLEMGRRGILYEERLEELERRPGASARIIAQSVSSVVFLQGAYSFREKSTNRMLRLVVDKNGQPLLSPRGEPMLTLEGDGPVAERQLTGTAFAVVDGGNLLTNRHVAQPWEYDANVELLKNQGFEPVMIKLIAYLPGKPVAHEIEVIRVSAETDLALVRYLDDGMQLKGLKLADTPPSPGDDVIVLGYPTGLRSMLAQAGEAFVRKLQETKTVGFWNVAARLAKVGRIAPLASRGIVGQVSEEAILFDAETTLGGSGGPVIDLSGSVVAVNTAIVPPFGGSNIGTPAAKVRRFLKSADSN